MSTNTNIELRKLFIYQVYLRNHTESGTIKEFITDLDRIKDLGVDVVYLMPIHEIGQKNKKGDLGCPYSIKDYRSVNHEYGTLDDFKELIEEVHTRDMKLMIDVVYNHTSYDSVLIQEHPEYFFKRNGDFANRVGDWWDIADLDYTKDKGLWKELIETLIFWSELGVDGYRWDVASFLPLSFLEEAHERVLEVNQDTIFLSESVHGDFLRFFRNEGFKALSEGEVYQVFDMAYDYDTHPLFEGYLKGESSLNKYIDSVLTQEQIYPQNYVKLRNLENHDFGRFAKMVDSDVEKIDNWTAFMFFNKGCAMIYAGQEFCDTNRPSLFDIDKTNWDGRNISPLIKKLNSVLKDELTVNGVFNIKKQEIDVITACYMDDSKKLVGIFNVGKEKGYVKLPLPDGTYNNLLGDDVVIEDEKIKVSEGPAIFYVE